ncbi:ROK family protein [Acetatifactor muris]|jgi:glucokinase|uniref:Glucokinase n=1 Tax=Acetatifactor muris TaxID=879566 RepID=A0A2K4ZC43_9FIRM|nr:ROK family protein [Acetatifactor muris]MCI8799363.1 ROK family protein [Lachnospiraceae bacterium]MCR2046403.1 ROK family protein [Acetatifactor muris]SOY28028.1 Glucokinase [Acetatifactor muris]
MYDIGIDVGGTGITAGLVDDQCRLMAGKSIVTDRNWTAVALAEVLLRLVRELMAENNVNSSGIHTIGVGVPGTANGRTGRIEYANNLPFCQGNLRELLQRQTSKKIYFENDANAAAWGEYLVLDKKPESFLMVTLGTGVGGGIIQDGKILRGVNYAAGELGHMTIRYNGIPCNCGRRGCLEAYASAEALIARARKAMDKKRKSLLWELCRQNQGDMNARLVFDAYRQGDKTAIKVVRKYAEYLSEGLANLINILQPEVLCIGGGVSRSGDILIPLLQERVSGKIYSRDSAENTVLTAARLDNDAGIIGAAKLRLCENGSVQLETVP